MTTDTLKENGGVRDAAKRAAELLGEMSLEEKIYQVTAEMIFDPTGDYRERRDPMCGSYRNPGHFMHYKRETPASPAEVARQINSDVCDSIEAQPHGIPPIENGEALHGAQWGMATCFPQPIALASTFDPELVSRVADVIGKECAAVGVRQVFSPVVNLARDCRWGRTVETYGEDVKLSCDMGAAMCRGLQNNGVIATPKHFADNYAAGGRDSNYSETSERTMRETVLPPFRACFEAGAKSVMAAYNAWEGVPCSCSRRLLTDILRGEWGFEGAVVSDYGGVDGIETAHECAGSRAEAAAMALKAGLDIILPYKSFDAVREALDKGYITEEELDRNVLRVLTAKYRLGLFDSPYADPEAADRLVRCDGHRALALEAARESIILLKNESVLPLKKEKTRRVGVFGQSADVISVGNNYSGPYGTPWRGEDAPTPLEALNAFLDGAEVIYGEDRDIETLAPSCDAVLYFAAIVEGEGSDRSDLRLPSVTVHKTRADDGGIIVDEAAQEIREDQEKSILRLCGANPNTVVVLMNGAPIDMRAWIDRAPAVIEAWYPGEQGAKALTEILFGVTSPGAKLPISVPKSAGQLPLFYAYKPSGRGYAYCDDDGRPMFPFGFGLSYTSFELSQPSVEKTEDGWTLRTAVTNTGGYDGAEVVQVYLHARRTKTVLPVKELTAYRRVSVKRGETVEVDIPIPADAVRYYDADMRYGAHGGDFSLLVGTSSDDTPYCVELQS
ncbi:MAG: glycoside hydrolase family 3 C-terminal domain-containing protein [Clostridiales bacterium]|nr:glycoside hydrolase family 3 C-terminal domain-containing protein [Clostridiales bacterium]